MSTATERQEPWTAEPELVGVCERCGSAVYCWTDTEPRGTFVTEEWCSGGCYRVRPEEVNPRGPEG